jgi:hypothetical protein
MPDDQRHDGCQIRKYHQKLIREVGIDDLQSNLRRFRKTEAKRSQERDERAPATKHHTGHGKKAAAGYRVFHKRLHLHDRPRITGADICETVNDAPWNYHAGTGSDGLGLYR